MIDPIDRPFTHPNVGTEARVEIRGCEVRLVIIASTTAKAESLFDSIKDQLERGALNLTLMGKPSH